MKNIIISSLFAIVLNLLCISAFAQITRGAEPGEIYITDLST